MEDAVIESPSTKKFDLTKFLTKSLVLHVIQERGQVTGITTLGSDVFVVRRTSQVDVYNSSTFTSRRKIAITGSEQLRGIVSCSHNNCLYVSDPEQKIIYRYDLSNNVTTKWSVKGTCNKLSVTKYYNVLATLMDTRRIQEYTTDGSLIRDIILDSSVVVPRQSAQLSTGNFVVSHGGKQLRVCIVDKSGHVIKSYGDGLQWSSGKHDDIPLYMVIDMYNNVLVADCSRLQLLSPTLIPIK